MIVWSIGYHTTGQLWRTALAISPEVARRLLTAEGLTQEHFSHAPDEVQYFTNPNDPSQTAMVHRKIVTE